MSWASHRETSRVEDITFCLLGLFDVNMPLLYGEGSITFRRLQEENLKKFQHDESILVWRREQNPHIEGRISKLLADIPREFADASLIRSWGYIGRNRPTLLVIFPTWTFMLSKSQRLT
jgi:hypothetical protein